MPSGNRTDQWDKVPEPEDLWDFVRDMIPRVMQKDLEWLWGEALEEAWVWGEVPDLEEGATLAGFFQD